ncbi:MAG: hypothetical protein JWL71_434 [Acidobacteria bacterium]|nr:hypothetical protein [Acidobacteriota bacterium]
MASPARSQVDLLGNDIKELRRILDEHRSYVEPLSDLTDVDRHAHALVVADLFWQCWYLAMGADVLIREELHGPLVAVGRMLFEGLVTLAYLQQHADGQREAVIFLAYSFLKQIAYFPDQAPVVTERESLLARMPADAVAEARQRLNTRPKNWSGKSIEAMAYAADVRGYDTYYRYFSAEAHVSMVGQHARVLTDDGGSILKLGRSLTPHEMEGQANMVRRYLHSAFRLFWDFVGGGEHVEFRTEDPESWYPPSTSPPAT